MMTGQLGQPTGLDESVSCLKLKLYATMHTFALLSRSAFRIACSGSGSGSGPGAGTVLTVVSLFYLAKVTDTGEVVKASTRSCCCRKSTSRMNCEISCSTTMKLCSGISSMPLSFTAALTLFTMGSSSPPAETSLSFGISPALVISCLTSDTEFNSTSGSTQYPPLVV